MTGYTQTALKDAECGWFLSHVYYEEQDEKTNVCCLKEITDGELAILQEAKKKISSFVASQRIHQGVIANRNQLLSSMVTMAASYLHNHADAEDLMNEAMFTAIISFANHGNLRYVDGTGDFSRVRSQQALLSR